LLSDPVPLTVSACLVVLAVPVVDVIGDRYQWLLLRSLFDDCSCMLVILCPCDKDYIKKDGCFTITFHAIVFRFWYYDLGVRVVVFPI